jgi:hypothetical protein
MQGRRLEDRIRRLSEEISRLATEAQERQSLIEQIKADISEYFEREKNPQYTVEKRSPGGNGSSRK